MFLFRLLLIALCLLGPTGTRTVAWQIAEEETGDVFVEAAVERRAAAHQPPPPRPRDRVRARGRRRRHVRSRASAPSLRRVRHAPRVVRRVLYGSDDGDPDAA